MDEKDAQNVLGNLQSLDPELATDIFSYVFLQHGNPTRTAVINEFEKAELLRQSVRGLNQLIFLKHFSRDLKTKRYVAAGGRVVLSLLITKPLRGSEKEIVLSENEASRPITIKQ